MSNKNQNQNNDACHQSYNKNLFRGDKPLNYQPPVSVLGEVTPEDVENQRQKVEALINKTRESLHGHQDYGEAFGI